MKFQGVRKTCLCKDKYRFTVENEDFLGNGVTKDCCTMYGKI